MLDAFRETETYFAQNYAGIIGLGLPLFLLHMGTGNKQYTSDGLSYIPNVVEGESFTLLVAE